MRNFVVVLLMTVLLAGLDFAETSAASALAAGEMASTVSATTSHKTSQSAARRLCWRNVLVPDDSGAKSSLSSSCGAKVKHPCCVGLAFLPQARQFHLPVDRPPLSGRSGGGLFRPPIA